MVRAGLMAYPSAAVDSCLFAHDDIVNTHDNSRRAPGINPSKQNDSRSNYISCSKAHRRFSYGFQRHYNDFMTENTIAHQWNLEVVTQRNGRECWVENCASLTDWQMREGRCRGGCAAGWRRCHSARTRMSPNKHGGTVFRDVGRKWSFCPGCSALSDNMWFRYWHDPEVNETCNKMCQTRRICILPCRRPFNDQEVSRLVIPFCIFL